MSSVSELMAMEFACQAVASNLLMPLQMRSVFTNISPHLGIGDVAEFSTVLSGKVEDRSDWLTHEPIIFPADLMGGTFRFSISTEHSQYPWFSTDGERTSADLLIKEVLFKKDGKTALELKGQDLPSEDSFEASSQWRTEISGEHQGFRTEGETWVSFEADLPEGGYEVELRIATSVTSNNVNDGDGFQSACHCVGKPGQSRFHSGDSQRTA